MYNFKEVYEYSKDLNVLYVEDNIELLEENSVVFENFFKNVDKAIDGVDGLDKYSNQKKINNKFYDIVITDISMPKKDGMEMIKDIININPRQHIVVVSAYDDSDRLINMIQLGISGFILKPINMDQLLQIFFKVCQSLHHKKLQEQFMIQQSKMAVMGEMMDAVAHQWKQPLNIISLKSDFLYETSIDGIDITNEMINKCNLGVKQQVCHLVNTLDEFRNFFRPNKNITTTTYKELVDRVMLLMKDNLIKHQVQIEINLDDSIKLQLFPNEFKHVLINIINNAIEAFKENHIEDRKLIFNTTLENGNKILNIIDNASGIPNDIIDKIFSQNFTTKEKGTGVGLYLSLQIIQKIGGNISVKNIDGGAKFSIELRS